MKKRTLFLGFLLMLALSTAALAADYTDVPADSWARESIDKAAAVSYTHLKLPTIA